MSITIGNIGVDLVDVARFRSICRQKKAFLEKVFSDYERKHCFSYEDYAPHFAGVFAAKEAAVKAIGADKHLPYEIEVRYSKSGRPELWKNGVILKNARLSISHTRTSAIAIVLLQ